jgi:spore germination protein YaaH
MKHYAAKTGIGTSLIALTILLIAYCSSAPANSSRQPYARAEIQLNEVGEIPDEEIAEIEEEEPPLDLPQLGAELPVTAFKEIWGYVVAGRESSLSRNYPLTDVVYFNAEVDSYGKLTGVPRRRNITFSGKVHFSVTCGGRALTHFVLAPGSNERKELIADLLAAARDYDGLQIDFENVPARDGDTFLSFIRELRAGLGDKFFTIALPARTSRLANDVYDYERIKPHVDRILVMAYDEHWSGSSPGSVASLQWCRRVAEYSLRAIGQEKLIMGLPFYGRAWGDSNPSVAYTYPSIQNLIKDRNVTDIRRENGIPTFDYNISVSVKVYYEDVYSLSARMQMYRSMNVNAIGFWRIGQETTDVWRLLRLEQ